MEIREIEAFLAVARELHFGRAAADLGISTPRVSQAVRALERRVGALLFERTSRRVRLTPLGERLEDELRPAYDRMERALREAQRSVRPGVLRVGVATSLPEGVPDRPIRAFERAHPQCAVVRSAHPNTDPVRWRGDWPVDLFIGWLPADPSLIRDLGVRVGPALLRDERVVLVAAGHPLARRAVVDAEELVAYDVLYPSRMPERIADLWIPRTTPSGVPLRRVARHASASIEEAIILVGEGDVVHLTVASLHLDDPHVVTVPVYGLPPMICAPVWPAGARNPMIQEFVRVAAETAWHEPTTR
ncbi:LysR family transcriptional regulator [Actinoallomurus purpureus]|uniref:LysR family transcriptional regulator n=1 Tax=Actinoallomurus purpureus TaxID=478114 RepID=UPI0020936B68|nr:LysR family transcriptional regulator [Actinoallomurus purpureus]MCO6005778.1 LysR family transcriptional regulator [Actinoallomurus purpureus]